MTCGITSPLVPSQPLVTGFCTTSVWANCLVTGSGNGVEFPPRNGPLQTTQIGVAFWDKLLPVPEIMTSVGRATSFPVPSMQGTPATVTWSDF